MDFLNKKIILITNIPTPYRIPLFNELDKQFKQNGYSFLVVFGGLGYPRRKWEIDMTTCKFDFVVLNSNSNLSVEKEKVRFCYSGIWNIIKKENPSVIITNGFSIATTKIWFRSFSSKIPYIIWSGAVLQRSSKISIFNKILRSFLTDRATRFIAYGTKAKEYLISLGADSNKIHISINTVDIDYYILNTMSFKNNQNQVKKRILYIGHLTEGKRIDNLFYAIKLLSIQRKDIILDIIGDGPEKHNLKIAADKLQISQYVKLHGFKQKEYIINFLKKADCFVFPSVYDIWGLVLNEAMASGLPCISSIYSGATIDLIEHEKTGFAMDFSKHNEVAEKINWILNNPDESRAIGKNARKFITKNCSTIQSAQNFVYCIKSLHI